MNFRKAGAVWKRAIKRPENQLLARQVQIQLEALRLDAMNEAIWPRAMAGEPRAVEVAIKMALFPLHVWLPNAYTFAPSTVTAFLAATATKVSVYVFIRFIFTVYGPDYAPEIARLDNVLIPLALVGIFVASTVAIFQRNIKRMLAYSSIAQVGYMALGIGFATVTGLTGGIVHIFKPLLKLA